ncbi:MAG: calcium-binding protein [Leptolyngbya sp. IPPAS B-1204]|nr:hypothetical protein [Elainella sp. C42_A2020_010]RNJ67631.1 MAG: hypothetical protein EDM05_19060 [Leptolyngbya sp. IPPAS B-1204]
MNSLLMLLLDTASLIQFAGNDTISGTDGDDTLNGGLENDTVYGGNGNDKLGDVFLDISNDDYLGSDGNVIILGGSGLDVLDGDTGNDILVRQGCGEWRFCLCVIKVLLQSSLTVNIRATGL